MSLYRTELILEKNGILIFLDTEFAVAKSGYWCKKQPVLGPAYDDITDFESSEFHKNTKI